MWHEWIAHTNFSFLTGASHPHELVGRAAALGYKGLAITDLDGAYGLARSYRALKKLRDDRQDKGFRLYYGAEIHLAKDHDRPIALRDTLVLVARTHLGYFNLCRILSYAHRDGKLNANVPLEDLAAQDLGDLVAIQPMRGLSRRRGMTKAFQTRCAHLRELFGNRLHFAVTRLWHPAEDHGLAATVKLARELSSPLLLSQDAFFHEPARKSTSDLLNAIRLSKPVGEVTAHAFVNAERHLHDVPTLTRAYQGAAFYAEAMENAERLAASITFDLKELTYRYPQEMLPAGTTNNEYLAKLSWDAARALYPDGIPPKVAEILAHELGLVARLGFADYFITVWDIVTWARAQGILCQGRGSAANSAICFVLGVTSVDVSKHDMLFERFVSVERGDPPDIDVDFEHERREEVIQYIYRRFGRERAAMVANVITFCSRGALRFVGKALGVGEEWLDHAGRILEIREFRHGETGDALGAARELASQKGVTSDPTRVPWALWGEMASRILGFPRHLGIHSGGFVVTERAVEWIVPQEPATMENRTVIQWCKEDIEALDIFKIDVLALGMLTAIRKCFTFVRDFHARDLTLATIPQGDLPTYRMIHRADTVGTFQIESRAQMSMLPRLRPNNLYELAIEVAIVRPGPIQGKMVHPYLQRRNSREPITYPDPSLEPILCRTNGIPIFQEQVMRIAMAVGGFTAGESNELRRNMGSFAMKGDLSGMIAKLEKGMRVRGIAEPFIEQLLEQLKGFSHYGFPESHAISFALLAYVSAYLKRYYPAAFFAALLNSQPMGFYSPHVLLQTARHLGVEVRPPCVQSSHWDSTLEPQEVHGSPFAIRMGLRLVGSLREDAARRLVERRVARGGWASLGDFLAATSLNRTDVTALAAAGALQTFGLERRSALWIAEAAPFCSFLEDVEEPLALPQESVWERTAADFGATGTTLGPHPALILRETAWCYEAPAQGITLARTLTKIPHKREVTVFGMMIVRQMPPEAKGMMFATLEDETGLINLAFRPEQRALYRTLIDGQAFLCVTGTVQAQDGAYSILGRIVHAPRIPEADVVSLARAPSERPTTEKTLVQAHNYG